jgi:hypothetical protein
MCKRTTHKVAIDTECLVVCSGKLKTKNHTPLETNHPTATFMIVEASESSSSIYHTLWMMRFVDLNWDINRNYAIEEHAVNFICRDPLPWLELYPSSDLYKALILNSEANHNMLVLVGA